MERNTEDQLTLFAVDSLAKTSATPVKKQVLQAKEAPYTGKCLELLASVCRDTQFLKTSQHSLVETMGDGSQDFSMTWPRSGTMQSGTVYRLHTLAPPITEIGSGLWPTPTTMDSLPAKSERAFIKEMTVARKGRSRPANLRDFLARGYYLPTPTPTLSDAKGAPKLRTILNNKSNLCEVLREDESAQIYPNPQLVEEMMGFPDRWTDLGG